MMLTLTPHCWVPQSLATPQGGRAPSWGAPMALLPCVLCCPLWHRLEHQAPQLAAVGGIGGGWLWPHLGTGAGPDLSCLYAPISPIYHLL